MKAKEAFKIRPVIHGFILLSAVVAGLAMVYQFRSFDENVSNLKLTVGFLCGFCGVYLTGLTMQGSVKPRKTISSRQKRIPASNPLDAEQIRKKLQKHRVILKFSAASALFLLLSFAWGVWKWLDLQASREAWGLPLFLAVFGGMPVALTFFTSRMTIANLEAKLKANEHHEKPEA